MDDVEYLERIMKGEMLGPYYLDIGVTFGCNLRCVHCGRNQIFGIKSNPEREFLVAVLNALSVNKGLHDAVINRYMEQERRGRKVHRDYNTKAFEEAGKRARTPKELLHALSHLIPSAPQEATINASAHALRVVGAYLVRWFTTDMGAERMMKLVDEAHEMGTQSVSLAGIGEPLTKAPLVFKIMAAVKRYGMAGSLTTNGTLLTKEYAKRIVDMGWDSVSLSLDGPRAEDNDSIRGKGAFEAALKGIRHLAEVKDKTHSNMPVIEVNTVLTTHVMGRLEDLMALAKDIGAERVNLLPLMLHDINARALDPTGGEAAYKALERAARVADRLGLKTNAGLIAKARMPLSTRIYLDGGGKKDWEHMILGIKRTDPQTPYTYPTRRTIKRVTCLEPWLAITIDSNGSVKPCCLTYLDFLNLNVRHRTLRDVWYSDTMNYVRKTMLSGQMPEGCRGVCHPLQRQRSVEMSDRIRERGRDLRRFLPW